MRVARLLALTLPGVTALAVACQKPAPPPPPVEAAPPAEPEHRTTRPAPLARRTFALPEPQEATLSNGLRVVLVENHEVPLVYVNLVTDQGEWTDPDARPGLASVTMDMLNEGAGKRDAAAISKDLRKIGASLGSSAGLDGAGVSVSSMKKNLEPALDIMADVVRRPTFPRKDWDLMKKKRLAELTEARQDPGSMAHRAWSHLLYGDTYAGRLSTEAGYDAITTRDMKSWWQQHLVPSKSLVLVGGDITLDEVVPMLEARLGSWKDPKRIAQHDKPTPDALPTHDESTIFLIDQPGAPQSVVRGGLWVGGRTDADWPAFDLANMAVGGQFTARINMNLREDKGWTYGARSSVSENYLPGLWRAGGSIVTPHTADAVVEILAEVNGALGDKPVTASELEAARGGLLGTWPLSFENPGYLLGETADMWRYDLPGDWLSGRIARYEAVTLEQANAAFAAHIDPAKMVFVIVGDAKTIKGPLAEQTGLPVVMVDADGRPVD
jgi:zinc protease